jgi:hypothetical protein
MRVSIRLKVQHTLTVSLWCCGAVEVTTAAAKPARSDVM